MFPLFLLFVILPISEIMVLINVSDRIGGWNTFFIVIVTAFFGAYFVRQQGFALVQQIQTKIANGKGPSNEMAEGLLLLVAGVLLITPGFITDIVGFLFTLPFSRTPIANFLLSRVVLKQAGNVHFSQGGFQSPPNSSQYQQSNNPDTGDIIDAEYTDRSSAKDENNDKNRLN